VCMLIYSVRGALRARDGSRLQVHIVRFRPPSITCTLSDSPISAVCSPVQDCKVMGVPVYVPPGSLGYKSLTGSIGTA